MNCRVAVTVLLTQVDWRSHGQSVFCQPTAALEQRLIDCSTCRDTPPICLGEDGMRFGPCTPGPPGMRGLGVLCGGSADDRGLQQAVGLHLCFSLSKGSRPS